ncbi:ferredoxin--NADP reductase [Lysobacter soyae]|uniref:Ferredoxin--NADP reductase n=1 Tax=Lysobacter soyae TaxID=2764185 RepID=A0ABX8WNQ5_9GAMM|nr:FAD-binding oxidoreductase [Lysobacter sp. CJ11]QYR53069.1 ferredoxin--NADP reductase [Lysobacter sp. CJ11]
MVDFFPIRLVAREMAAPSVLHLRFVRDDGKALDYTPGQFIQIHFPLADGSTARRSYSCATRHDHVIACGEAVEFVASCIPGGAATALFQGMAIGDTLNASGPLGLFSLKPGDANARYLLIATGTGVASYRSMLPDLERLMRERKVKVVVVHGVRTPDDLLFADEFNDTARRFPELFEYRIAFSRASFEAGDSRATPAIAQSGYVQSVLPALKPVPGEDIAYICGNPVMVDAVVELLKADALPMKDIRREKYISLK